MKQYLLLLFFCLLALPVLSQTFKGRVTDEKGNPVPYASLYLKELHSGFTTDDNGIFQTTLKPGNYTCEISSLGYTGQTLPIKMLAGGLEKNIVLAERIYELREVSVTKGSEDPAYAVMRRAIANAPYYRTQIKGYSAGTYLKGTGKGKKIPAILKISKEVRDESKKVLGKLFVLEEQRQVTFKAPNVWDSRVIAYQNSFPENLQVEIGLTTINLYEPMVFGRISPLSAGAFSYYRFKMEGCYAEGGHLVNKIKIIPKKDNLRLVSGYLYIIEDLWCLSAVEIFLDGGGMKATIKMTCKEVEPSVFLPTSNSMACTIDVMGFEAEASYLAAIHYTKVEVDERPIGLRKDDKTIATAGRPLTKKQQKLKEQIEKLSSKEDITISEAYQLSKLISKSVKQSDTIQREHKFERPSYTQRLKSKTDSLATKRDSLYWVGVRSVPLRTEEFESYVYKKKITLHEDSVHKQKGGKSGNKESVADKIISSLCFGNTLRTKDKSMWLQLYGLGGYVHEYNFVDGFWLGAKVTMGAKLSKSSSLRFTPSLYYTTARKTAVGSGELSLDYAPRRRGQLTLAGGVLSADYNGESGESRLINGVASSFFGRNDVKFYDKRFLTISHSIELANSLTFSAALTWQQRKMLENHISRSWFKRKAEPNIPANAGFRPMPKNELLKASFAMEYTPAHYYRMEKNRKVYDESKFPTFVFRYDRAFPLNGNLPSASYHLAEFSARQRVEFGMFNRIDWRVNAGTFWNADQIQFPDYKHFAGTHIFVTEHSFDSNFALLDNYAYSTATRWAQAHITWTTPYLIVKQLPFLRRKNFDEALHLRTLVVYSRRPYSELGYSVGFSGLARIGVFVGFEGVRYRSAGIEISLPLAKFVNY